MTDHQLSTRFRLEQVGQYMRNFAIASSRKLRFMITPPPLLFHKKKSWKTLKHALSNLNQILNYPPAWQHHWGGRESNPLPPRLMNRGRLPPTHYLHRFPRWPLSSSHSTPPLATLIHQDKELASALIQIFLPTHTHHTNSTENIIKGVQGNISAKKTAVDALFGGG